MEEQPLLCDGRSAYVRCNLHNALSQIVSNGSSRVAWADALTINQDDDNEKSKQVALIGDIYRLADYVLCWLGTES
jgi:Heterokaryon incompatibility protein (HET)